MTPYLIVGGLVVLGLLGWLAARRARPRIRLYRGERIEDLPEQPEPFILYIAGSGINAWAASMICPCGCRETIELNLLKQVRPQWEVTENANGTVSLDPSVWRNGGCRSHFILSNGTIRWCD